MEWFHYSCRKWQTNIGTVCVRTTIIDMQILILFAFFHLDFFLLKLSENVYSTYKLYNLQHNLDTTITLDLSMLAFFQT